MPELGQGCFRLGVFGFFMHFSSAVMTLTPFFAFLGPQVVPLDAKTLQIGARGQYSRLGKKTVPELGQGCLQLGVFGFFVHLSSAVMTLTPFFAFLGPQVVPFGAETL